MQKYMRIDGELVSTLKKMTPELFLVSPSKAMEFDASIASVAEWVVGG